jgi:eukaryotic-like serine/threonine-protein kinase
MNEAVAASFGNRISNRYTLLEKLGVGGQGEVWRARDEARGVELALKLLSPGFARNEAVWAALEHEHAVVSRLNHPGILKIYPPQREGDSAVLPMDLAIGGDLRRMRGANYLEIVPVLMEIAQALEHAHERGVVHRDLKPGNVLFDERASVRIADFGVASAREASGELARLASERTRPGLSPFTASPEQLRGQPPAVTDDIYGLGALAYELLSGYPPYYPRFELRKVLEEPVPELKPIHPLPPQLSALVMRMLAKNAAERPQSMREIIDALDVTLNDTLTFEFEDLSRKLPPAPPPPRAPEIKVEQPAPVQRPQAAPPVSRPAPPATAPQAAPSPWGDLKFDVTPKLMRLEPEHPKRWPWAVLAVVAVLAFGAFYWLPRYAPPDLLAQLPFFGTTASGGSELATPGATAIPAPQPPASPAVAKRDPAIDSRIAEQRAEFKQRLSSLDARAAGVWGGADFAAAKARAAESVGAYDGGNPLLAEQRLSDALRLLGKVESKASQAHAAQVNAGERALAAGQPEVARQAFELARRIDPKNRRVADNLRRVQNLGGVLPLLADGKNAEAAKEYARAIQDYSQVLSLDPNNADAKAGLARANAAFGEDTYANAVGAGFAALGAGRLEEARVSFEKAHRIRPGGEEASSGLRRVVAALSARGFASTRQRASALEAEERWSEALKEYEAALKLDPSLAFAQDGKERAADRAQLAGALQALIDEPDRLAAPSVRADANALITRARAIPAAGPVLRSQLARLQILLPEFDKPVRLALVSDNATQVAIQRVGAFGSFSRREIELKPGKYTVVGTRSGFRDVRRDVTIAPGNSEVQTINVSCIEPI